jgi:hypothetical protein
MSKYRQASPPASPDPVLAEHVSAIRTLGRRTVENVIEIGRRLTECKKLVGHGNWLPWLEREFGWSDRTALNFMRVAELSKSETVSNLNLPVKALYLLAAPSTPDEARDEIIERAQAGEPVPVTEVKRIIEDTKQPARNTGKLAKGGQPHQKKAKSTGSRADPVATLAEQGIDKHLADDIGANGAPEAERLRARNEELEREKGRLEIKITVGVTNC